MTTRPMIMIGRVRRNPATVVVLAGQPAEQVLATLSRSLNVVLVRPETPPAGAGAGSAGAGSAGAGSAGAGRAGPGGRAEAAGIDAAAAALRRAAGISAPYVLVAADPLREVAAAWQAMWQLSAEPQRSDEFELRAAQAMGAWRAKRFELPDYYLVLADEGEAGGRAAGTPGAFGTSGASGASGAGEARADFYLGPLRAVRPNRVAVAAGASPAAQADALLSELGSLPHGPWWPPLDEVLRTARGFYPGSLAESPTAGRAGLLG